MTGKGCIGTLLTEATIRELCATEVPKWNVAGKRVLAIVPDGTRTAPMGAMFRILHEVVAKEAKSFDVLIALGTHPPMSEEAINARFELTPHERSHTYGSTKFLNHRWDDPAQLVSLGVL